jgi:hypothetical protein
MHPTLVRYCEHNQLVKLQLQAKVLCTCGQNEHTSSTQAVGS